VENTSTVNSDTVNTVNSPSVGLNSVSEVFTCKVCGKQFKHLGALHAHEYYKHGIKHEEKQVSSIFVPPRTGNNGEIHSETNFLAKPLPTFIQPQKQQIKITETEIELTPVSRPVRLNALVLLYYDEAKKMGYEGDLGDFITECVVDYFRRTMGLKLGFFKERVE